MSKKTKIYLYVPWVFDRLGGVDVIVDSLSSAFTQAGYDAFIVEQSWDQKSIWINDRGQRFLGLNFVPMEKSTRFYENFFRVASFLYRSVLLLWHFKSNEVDVVNAHFPTKHLFLVSLFKIFKLWNGKLILSFHGSDVNDIDCDQFRWRLVIKKADLITFCSVALKNKFQSVCNFEGVNLKVVYNGVDYEQLQRSSLEDGAKIRSTLPDKYFLSLANFVPNKGQDLIVRALPKLEGVSLVLAGGYDNGNWVAELQGLAKELGVEDRVWFTFNVPHEEVPCLLKGASALILSSHYESFGLVVAEAASVGIPVIATNVGGVPEILPDDDYGFLIAPNDVVSLSNAIEWVNENPSDARARAVRLRKRVEDRFSLDRMGKEYLELMV